MPEEYRLMAEQPELSKVRGTKTGALTSCFLLITQTNFSDIPKLAISIASFHFLLTANWTFRSVLEAKVGVSVTLNVNGSFCRETYRTTTVT
jgi:hypothetical protein